MDEIKRLYNQYAQQIILISACLMAILVWSLLLKSLAGILAWQNHKVLEQQHEIVMLKKMPANWYVKTNITELAAILTNNWHNLLPEYQQAAFTQPSATTLKLVAAAVDEQKVMQWFWAMQKQYNFAIISFEISRSNKGAMVDIVVSLQIICIPPQ